MVGDYPRITNDLEAAKTEVLASLVEVHTSHSHGAHSGPLSPTPGQKITARLFGPGGDCFQFGELPKASPFMS